MRTSPAHAATVITRSARTRKSPRRTSRIPITAFAVLAAIVLAWSPGPATARPPESSAPRVTLDPALVDLEYGVPARAPQGFARADTLDFGYFTVIGGGYYAVQGETWTWDHGSANVAEGWYSVVMDHNPSAWFRRITAADWQSDPLNPPVAPIIAGAASAWVGLYESEARALCWDAGLGYGDGWCQRLTSPTLTYDGTGSVSLSMQYWNDTEPDFDYTKVILRRGTESIALNAAGFTGVIGTYASPRTYTHLISNAEFGGGSSPVAFHLEFEFASDLGWSDEDGEYPTAYGPFGADDVALAGNLSGGDVSYGFEPDLQGWTASTCGYPSFFGIANVSDYVIQDPCGCRLEGNLVEMHDDNRQHPVGQHEGLVSPVVDRTALHSYNQVFVEWDQYSELPQSMGVFYRAGYYYYPWICPNTGEAIWSPRVGNDIEWFYTGDYPVCFRTRDVATDWGVPASSDLVRFVYEIYSSCEAFGIPSTVCTGWTNFTPIIDNVRFRMTALPEAPPISFEVGGMYQDVFSRGLVLSTTDPGNADCTYDLHRTTDLPDLLGDSLQVKGPTVSSTNRFSCKLWFRIRRQGPGNLAIPGYIAWKDRVRDGRDIVGPAGAFTWGWMDSMEVGTAVYKNKYVSSFREDDDDYVAPDWGDANEIIADGVLGPGTQIEYFVTSAYICTPSIYWCLPDTAGRFYDEFEILPSYRTVAAVDRFPCVLLVNAGDRLPGSKRIGIEDALHAVLDAGGGPSPNPATWDRYDYTDASSSWCAPLFRNSGGNAGATLPQLLGYRFMVVSTGTLGADVLEQRDWVGFGDWLTTFLCYSNQYVQGWYGTGDNLSQAAAQQWSPFLTDVLGVAPVCDTYRDEGCPPGETDNDQNYCVRLEPAGGGAWDPVAPLDVWGNGCPAHLSYDVLAATATGVGNKNYRKVDSSASVSYAQVTNDRSGAGGNFRSVLDGYWLGHLTRRDPNDPGPETECPNDPASIAGAAADELAAAIRWTLGIDDPHMLADLCINPCQVPGLPPDETGPGVALVNRLDQNTPNPFNPRTTIRYSIAADGPVRLVIYDVTGRTVRTLVNAVTKAGPHQAVWDGSDDSGRRLPAGIYWSRLTAGQYRSNRKMVILE